MEGKMNRAKCREILDENLLQSTQDLRVEQRFTLQQGNNPKHIVKTTLWDKLVMTTMVMVLVMTNGYDYNGYGTGTGYVYNGHGTG
jgi:hypothetical protein